MKAIFVGNFDFEARSSDLERLFRRYGKVDRVDMKSGYAFIHMDDERDAEYAIRALDRSEFGRKGRRLSVEWSKHERVARKPVSSRRSTNLRPSRTLFVINFPYDTTTRDLERHFDPYGKIVNVRIRRNFAFVEYESQEDATKALEATNLSKLQDRVISVEYSSRDGDDRRGGYSPDRRRRSPSPYRRERGSPDYGTGSSPTAYRRGRGSPDYGTRGRGSPDYGARGRGSPDYGARLSRSPRRVDMSPKYGPRSSRSPRRAPSRPSPHYGRERSPDPRYGERHTSDGHDRNRSPYDGERNGNGNGNGDGDGYGRRPPRIPSPFPEEGAISDDGQDEPRSPINKPDLRDTSPLSKPGLRERSPIDEYGSPIGYRQRSRSPPMRERSQS